MDQGNKDKDKEEATSASPYKTFCSRKSEIIILLWIVFGACVAIFGGTDGPFVALVLFFGFPGICLLLRYLWLRLCRDPFLAQSDTLSGVFWESLTTCPPDVQRTVPTILFVVLIFLEVLAVVLGPFLAGEVDPNPNWFTVVFYNGFGSLLILVCAVWLVDFLWLAWLFIVVDCLQGKHGAAQNWWWKGILAKDEIAESVNIDEENVENQNTHPNDDSKSAKLDDQRRLARIRLAITLTFYIWWTVWAVVAAYSPQTLELSIPVPRLPPQCDGYRLAVAADLHAGSMAGVKDTEWMVNKFNSLNPDAVALVGDIGDTAVNSALRAKLDPLSKLEAPDGAFLSFGNHENLHNIDEYRKLLRTEGAFDRKITLLENEHVILNRNGAGDDNDCSIMLVGMADWSGMTRNGPGQVAPDLPLALVSTATSNGTTVKQDAPPSSSLPMVMMQHQPANMVESAKAGVGLQLSGHTHGGQVWPQHITLGGYDAISGLHAFDVGSVDGPSYLFVSEGIVGWGPRLRFLCKTDLAVLTLRTPSLMEAEGALVDTGITVATIAMYAAYVLVPLGILFCSIPFVFMAYYKWCVRGQSTKSDENRNDEEDNDEVAGQGLSEGDGAC